MPARYRLIAYRRLDKDLASLPPTIRDAVRSRIGALADDPRPPDAKALQGQRRGEHYRRIRVGSYRVVYEVLDEALEVRVILIGHRRDVYALLRRR